MNPNIDGLNSVTVTDCLSKSQNYFLMPFINKNYHKVQLILPTNVKNIKGVCRNFNDTQGCSYFYY